MARPGMTQRMNCRRCPKASENVMIYAAYRHRVGRRVYWGSSESWHTDFFNKIRRNQPFVDRDFPPQFNGVSVYPEIIARSICSIASAYDTTEASPAAQPPINVPTIVLHGEANGVGPPLAQKPPHGISLRPRLAGMSGRR
jgi:hypothetical protein